MWTARFYTQVGWVALNGTTLSFAYWPAPHGAQFIEISNGAYYDVTHPDWVGSARVISNQAHSVAGDLQYSPYGEITAEPTVPSNSLLEFAGLTQNFYKGALMDSENREYSITPARWLSPDPAATGWNQYAYPTNPNSFTDPTGLDGCNILNVSYEGSGNGLPCPDDPGNGNTNGPDASSNAPGPIVQPPPPPLPPQYYLPPPYFDASIPTPEGFPTFLPGFATQRPTVPGVVDPEKPWLTDSVIFTGCGGPSGTSNGATNCGTQVGDDLKTIPKWYVDEANLNHTVPFCGPYFVCSSQAPSINSGWQVMYSSFGFSTTDVMGPVFPNPFQFQGENPLPSCTKATNALLTFIATHPGTTPPAALTGAMGPACSGL